MQTGFIFWLLMLLWGLALLGAYMGPPGPWVHAGSVFLYILLFLLGWAVFGFMIKNSGKAPPQ